MPLDLAMIYAWGMTPKAQATEARTVKLGFHQTQNFCASKGTRGRVR